MNGFLEGLAANPMTAPFVMCLVLTGIHGYLGIHVLRRKVIFVDLALAQIAALGATCAYVLGWDAAHHPSDAVPVYWFSLSFTVLGAAVFSLTRMRREEVPQEAFIGIVYAAASAIAILLLAKAPGEGEHIKTMLVGNILLVRWRTVLSTAAIYAVIGLFHFLFRRRFFLISDDPERAEREGVRVRRWDFLFYVSFGVVVTSSVTVAGVLLVFTYLVVPATCAVLLAARTRTRIGLAWAIGALASFGGVTLSYQADLPTGPAVVGAFAAVLLAVGGVHAFLVSPAPLRTLARAGGVAALAAAMVLGLLALRKPAVDEHHQHAGELESWIQALGDADEARRIDAVHHLEESRDPHALEALLAALPSTSSESPVLEHLLEGLARSGDARAVEPLLEVTRRPDLDPLLSVRSASAILQLRDPRGLGLLVEAASSPESPEFAREEALRELRRWTARDPGPPERWRAWWEEMKDRVRWRENLKKYQ